ncbi:DNA integrity scanning protein DisA [Candidatus Pacearchaeota archaeon]|nr:DNA integrity scanning protein DisA [Candidatus Pacearchaeota archaeon]
MESKNELIILKEEEKNHKKQKSEEKDKNFVEVLKKFSPGTAIRTAVDDILRSRMGALIVIDCEGLSKITYGGFKVDSKFSSQKLVELAKMDGAIILSEGLKMILNANVFLSPKMGAKTKGTGARHKVAEMTAEHVGTIVVAVSERKNKITLYYGDVVYELEKSSEVLRRAAETLQILEKQKEIFNDSINNLNILEINNLVTMSDVCDILQRIEIIRRISEMVKRYLIELGREGLIVSMRLKELTRNLNKERELILKDYFKIKSSKTDNLLKAMNFDLLIETQNLSKVLFQDVHDKALPSKGLRILSKVNITGDQVKLLVNSFKTLSKIFTVDKNSLMKSLKDEKAVESLTHDLESVREKIMAGKVV